MVKERSKVGKKKHKTKQCINMDRYITEEVERFETLSTFLFLVLFNSHALVMNLCFGVTVSLEVRTFLLGYIYIIIKNFVSSTDHSPQFLYFSAFSFMFSFVYIPLLL